VAFFRGALDPDNIVVDIGLATEVLKAVLKPLNYSNLDERPEFAGQVTTTEFLARHIWEGMGRAVADGRLGPHAAGVDRLRVTLNESHVARAWYEAALGA
jgi:6-pyruvoyl-tetrahydropterin synthase